MRILIHKSTALAVVLVMLTPVIGAAQSATDREKAAVQTQLTSAEAALASAQASGAQTLARDLYEEAARRLQIARGNWGSNDRDARHTAGLRAIEAGYAAAAAEALAQLVASNTEVRGLRTEIGTFGGSAAEVALYDPPTRITPGGTSLDRVIVAENALKSARNAGGERVAAADLQRAQEILETARTVAKRHTQSATADHLAFVAEMMARRAEYVARRNVVSPRLPELRAERTRLAQQAANRRAEEEQARRLEAERQAADLRRQLANEAATQAELERLRQQVANTEAQLRTQVQQDRDARIAAERAVDEVRQRYEMALAERGMTSAEVEGLRRQLEDQSLTLRTIQDRERTNEKALENQIGTLESTLQRERNEGRMTAEALAQRENELRAQRDELARLRTEREESDRRRAEAETARAAAIADAERRRAEAETQAETLRQQVADERARASETAAELARAREELARRDSASQERITAMQRELAKLAETRTTERGLIVTLPGLFFDTGRAVLKAGARNTLSRIAEQLRINDQLSVAIEGHTDSVGSDASNQALSEKRAAAVRDYLRARGIPASRMTVTGLGETTPVATNDTPAGRQQNRRVELVIAQ
ncbi:MAG TPA: OmpA family protein [Thermoanaerobaculia bacterium]|jgi:outer membrane protein OmpA-like peptidoglycan-associated protein|nr:OmpA family protein [Thermoanaerobaculia bacterium]